MRKPINLLTLLLLLLGSLSARAQEPCGADVIHQRKMAEDERYRQRSLKTERRVQQIINAGLHRGRSRSGNDTIPVVVHVLHTGQAVGTGYNISDAQVQSSIDRVNEAFANYDGSGSDTGIRFALAKRDPNGCATSTGINRIDATGVQDYENVGISTSTDRVNLFNLSRWNTEEYLNFWVVSEIDNNNGNNGTQGYATFSNTSHQYDGVVCMYNTTGYDPTGTLGYELKSERNQNETVIHEFGHYLNLYHTFQGDDSGCPTDTDCTTDGDLCCDTAAHERTYSNVCWTGVTNSCTGNAFGQVVQNYMAYSSQDCKNRFTDDQIARMQAVLLSGRQGSLTSPGLREVTVSEPTTACEASTSTTGTGGNFGIGITKITIGSWTTESGNTYEDGGYQDRWCNHVELAANTTYNYEINTAGNYDEWVRAWIDYNNDGTFDNATELILSPSNKTSSWTGTFTTPASMTYNTSLRLRVRSDFSSDSDDACYDPVYGQAEDYSVYFANNAAIATSVTAVEDLHVLESVRTVAKTFTVSGTDLSNDASLSLGGSNFEISTDGNNYTSSLNLSQSGGNLSGGDVTIYVRLKSALSTGSYNDNLTISSSPATDVVLNLSGTVTTTEADRGNNLAIGTSNSSNYAIADDYEGITGTASRTYEAWVKTSTTDNGAIVANGINSTSQKWIIRLDGGQLRLEINGAYVRGTTSIDDGEWHHIAVVLNNSGSSTLNDVTLYVDGAVESLSGSSNTGNSINTATGQKLWVGMDPSNRGWSGNIDEVRVWSVVRTQNDIRNYMHLTLAGTETGLEAYYQFNESSGTSAGDKLYGYHLTMIGSAQFGTSTVDIGVGSMAATTLGSTGTSGVEVDLNNLQIDFADGSTLPNGELVIFRIEDSPANSPGDNYEGSEHWVVRNFGSNQTGLNVSALKLTLDPSDPILAYHPNTFKLYNRATGSDGAWTTMATEATSIDYVNGIICFEGLSGFTSFSQLMVGSTGLVLPVTLTRFEATRMDDTEVLIEWATSYEENCQLYAVEKSWDGKNFRAIEILDCENRGTQAVSYRHRDREAYAAYYRLRQVDEDQSYTLSDVRYVAGESPYRALEVYPNPSSGAVYLAVQNISAEQSIALRLIDLRGRELLVERGKLDVLTEGLNRSLDRIGPGSYFLQIDYGGQQLTQRLVRQ